MKTATIAMAMALSAGMVSAAAAQSSFAPLTQTNTANQFGDTNLAYQNGVVYDDDLVPGRGPNQNFLVGEIPLSSGGSRFEGGSSREFRPIRPNSRQLIRSDGTTSAVARRARQSEKRK